MSGLMDFAQGASKGMVAGGLGAPVDLAALALNSLIAGGGYAGHQMGLLESPPGLIDKPIGGSEWIADRMRGAGLLQDNPGSTADVLGQVAGGLLGPLTAAKSPKIASGLLGVADNWANASSPPFGSFSAQLGAISPEGRARLLADLAAGRGSGTYRLGDVTDGQAKMLGKSGMRAKSRDVLMTDDVLRHLYDKRILEENFTPAEVALFAEQAMAKRSRVDLNPAKARQQPSLLNEGLRDSVTGRRYDSRMPLAELGDGYEVRSVVPDGLPPRKK